MSEFWTVYFLFTFFFIQKLFNEGHCHSTVLYHHLPRHQGHGPDVMCTIPHSAQPWSPFTASHFPAPVPIPIGTITSRARIRHSLHQLGQSFHVLLSQGKGETQLFLVVYTAQGHPAWGQPAGSEVRNMAFVSVGMGNISHGRFRIRG